MYSSWPHVLAVVVVKKITTGSLATANNDKDSRETNELNFLKYIHIYIFLKNILKFVQLFLIRYIGINALTKIA